MMIYSPEARFQLAANFVLKLEGKLSDNPNDPGGITNYGISLRFLKAAGVDIDCDGDIDADDIRKVTPDKAKEIYREKWWNPYGYERIHSIEIAKRLFAAAIHMGQKAATKRLQNAINTLKYTHLEVDGILGIKTIAATNMADENKLLHALQAESEQYYRRIVQLHPGLSSFLEGWINRSKA